MAKLTSPDQMFCGSCGSDIFFVSGDIQGLKAICASCGEEILLRPQYRIHYWDIVSYPSTLQINRTQSTIK